MRSSRKVGNQGDADTCQHRSNPPEPWKRLAYKEDRKERDKHHFGPKQWCRHRDISHGDGAKGEDLPQKKKQPAAQGRKKQHRIIHSSRQQPEQLKEERHQAIAEEIHSAARSTCSQRTLDRNRPARIAETCSYRKKQSRRTHAGNTSSSIPLSFSPGHWPGTWGLPSQP